MGFGEAVKNCFSNYATFSGRASRSEYWFFFLFQILLYGFIAIAAIIIAGAGAAGGLQAGGDESDAAVVAGVAGLGSYIILVLIAVAGMFLPTLAVTIRRLHDSDKSGWFFLTTLIPVIGGLIFLILMLLPGTPGPNRFGPSRGTPELLQAGA